MQQFVVPQFIDVEDKVIGPITVRQFIILLASGGVEFIAWKASDFTLFLLITVTNAFLTMLFAFIKINGRPVHYLFFNIIQTIRRPHLRTWHKETNEKELKLSLQTKVDEVFKVPTPKKFTGTTRLAELSLIVDTGGVYEGEE